MISVTGRRPFSELGDQQLLEQTRRLAANQRCIDVHMLDHLDEIDRRGLALRRGFSSLFDYAVRELRFTDAAAQRRIQAMRLCRRHGWVRACLQSGELSMTAAAQLETTFAGAERAERQCHTGRRNVGQGRGHHQDHDCAGGTRQLGLPAAPGEADEQGERGHRSAPGVAPPAGECSGDVATANTPAMPVAWRTGPRRRACRRATAAVGVERKRVAVSGTLLRSRCCSRAGAGAGSAAPSSDEGPAPQLLPPTDLPASASAPVPEPVMAPSESRHTASRAPEPLGDDPFAELSPGTVSAAPLLHPQRQRELIEQAAGMSTRQVASLLAAAAPEVLPPCDTLRAAPPDRYTLKVSIDQECEQGLRLLKDLMSHVDPRMSWGDLVARLVRDAVARHDPRGGRRGQRRRKGADSAGASPRRAPKETHAAGAAGGPAQRVGESSGRAPNRTRATGAPVAPARRSGSETPAPPGDTAATDRQNPIGVLASAAPPSQSAPNRAFGWRPCRWRSIGRVRRYFGAAVRVRRLGRWLPCRRRCAGLAGRHFGAGAGTRRVPWRRTERRLSRSSGAHDPRTGSQPPPIPAAAPHSRSGPAPRLATRRWTLLLSRSALRAPLHLFPSAADRPPVASRPGRWPGAVQPQSPVRSSSPHAPRLRTGGSAGAADVTPPPRCWHAARLRRPTACRWPGGDSQRRQPSVYLRYRLFRPGPVAVDALMHGVLVVSRLRFPAASGVRTPVCPVCCHR